MKRITFVIASSIVSVFLSGYANAWTTHPENEDIVGLISGLTACFNNDGAIYSIAECDNSSVDEGYVSITQHNFSWNGGGVSGINGCGSVARNPVTSAICPFTQTSFDTCATNRYTLVQTTMSGHFWALKADSDCGAIEDIVPCRSTDAFDQLNGCASVNPPTIAVEGGYLKLDSYIGLLPPSSHCSQESHYGRMVVDPTSDRLAICMETGWKSFSAD